MGVTTRIEGTRRRAPTRCSRRTCPGCPRLERASPTRRGTGVDGSLVSVDISGFTALAERLVAKGKAGAEELVRRISACFDGLIEVAERHGGDVLKFRGDALLLLFRDDATRSAPAGPLRTCSGRSSRSARDDPGTVALRMSVGVHSGECHFFLASAPHRELLVAGPARRASSSSRTSRPRARSCSAPRRPLRSIPRGSATSARAAAS